MVQVDVFWSYGLASGLAVAASRQIRKEKNLLTSKPFVLSMLWTAVFFAPSGLYLLWAFPYWETMFVARTHTDIPPWLVCLFGVTNITQAWLGYWFTWKLIRAGKQKAAIWQPILGHLGLLLILIIGWDGTGIQRFTYAGNGDDWANGVPYDWTAFFTSPVFYTLLGMAVFLGPTYFYLVNKFKKEDPAISSAY